MCSGAHPREELLVLFPPSPRRSQQNCMTPLDRERAGRPASALPRGPASVLCACHMAGPPQSVETLWWLGLGRRAHAPPGQGSARRGLLSPRRPWGPVRPGQAHCGPPRSGCPHRCLHTPPSLQFPGLGHTNTLLTLQHPQHWVWGGPCGPPGPSPGQLCVLLLRGRNLCPPPQGHSWPTPSGDTALAESRDGPAPVNPPMAPSSPPREWPVTRELAHMRSPAPSSPAQAAGGGPWRDGQEEGQEGRAGAPAISTTAGGAAPGPLGGAG